MDRRGKNSWKGRETKWEYRGCGRKKKMKSSEASKLASKFGQRKYECSFCGHWHLTKNKGE